jgi:hypothetical protein
MPLTANYLWTRPVTPLASMRDGVTDVLGPHVLVGADPNTYVIAVITNVVGRERRIRRECSRPMTYSRPHSAPINMPKINDLARSTEQRPAVVGRQCSRPTGIARSIRRTRSRAQERMSSV